MTIVQSRSMKMPELTLTNMLLAQVLLPIFWAFLINVCDVTLDYIERSLEIQINELLVGRIALAIMILPVVIIFVLFVVIPFFFREWW